MLKYNGFGFLANVPARDLTKEETKRYGGAEYLISTGVYEVPPVAEKKGKKAKKLIVEEKADVEESVSPDNAITDEEEPGKEGD